ncbi:helix-turn-helix domain-containing protein [Methanobacterium alcaliphilum]|uniref:helix-turn-helix domain-containing protein n=1 Tax=Methanobacterium alcaliphilum TaxID=392018 RepID=UPI00200B32BC|nr:helix-turn-helix domain-containing protein [Methanobacterium alcaliphilum]MCK9152486.1 helix-turn-helix domain-containing protein [Methanobacterium alcaliphilum]
MPSEKVYVNQPLTSRKIMALLDQNPDLKEINCPTSIYQRISPKYLEALEELGIEVKSIERKGRPRKYSQNDRMIVTKLLKEGKSPLQVSGQMNIPLKTVYYLKKDLNLKKGRKFKYNEKTRLNIKKMAKQGVSPKEISSRLQIPLRTVYYILKR